MYSDRAMAFEISGLVALDFCCCCCFIEERIWPTPVAFPVAGSTLFILVRLSKVTLLCSVNYYFLNLNTCPALILNHCLLLKELCSGSRHTLNPLPESKRLH